MSPTEVTGGAPPAAIAGGARTVWLTGLPSAGKTTIGRALVEQLRAAGERAELLDGDEVRTILSRGLGFSREDRDENVRRVGWVADLLSRNGVWAVCTLISPYREARDQVGAMHGDRFVEVWVATSREECARRDVKGLYRRQEVGSMSQLTGADDPYEPPLHPAAELPTHEMALDACLDAVWSALARRGRLGGGP